MAYSSVAQTNRRAASTSYYSYVKPEFRKGFEIPLIPYQTNGILTRPLWNTKNHVIRIIPGYDPETGAVLRQNTNVKEYSTDVSPMEYLSDTFMQASTLQFFGEQKQTLISDYAPGSDAAATWGGDTVLHVFIRNVMNTVHGKRKTRFSATSEMQRWAEPKQGIIRFPKTSLLMQALTFTVNDRDSTDRDGNALVDESGSPLPLLAVVSVDGKQTLHSVLTALVEPSNPGEFLDALTNNKFGGMAEANGNMLFLNHVVDPQTGYNFLRPSVQKPGKGWTPTPYPLEDDVIKQLWHPWTELLQFLTVDEQLHLLSSEFGADSVNYLIGTDPLYASYNIPEDIARAGFGRYARFTGTKDVAQTIRLNDAPSAPAMKSAQSSPFGTPRPPVPTPAASSLQAPKLGGLSTANVVDPAKLSAEVAQIRRAAAPKVTATVDEQAAAAEELLNGVSEEGDPAEFGL